MDIETYQKATEIVERMEACRKLLSVVCRESSFFANGVSYYLSKFANSYREDFIAYINQKLEEDQRAFAELQWRSCDK